MGSSHRASASLSEEDGDRGYSFREQDDEVDIDEFIAANESSPPLEFGDGHARKRERLFAAFMIFGLLNNVLYVIILSAALDLVPSTTPKGVVAFFNIFPALLTKVGWPIVSNGTIRYTRRVGFCTVTSWLGIMTIAFSSSVYPRLLGISLASLSSGLGELTFLQLTTTLPTRSSSKVALGAWSSGTGFAGIAGAGIWWLLRGLGVRGGLGLSSFLPLFFPLTYKYLLPPFSVLAETTRSNAYQALSSGLDAENGTRAPLPPSIFITSPSTDVIPPAHSNHRRLGTHQEDPDDEEDDEGDEDVQDVHSKATPALFGAQAKTETGGVVLSIEEKMRLVRPLLFRYMVPLCAVYIEEYVINSGVAPTLVFPLPSTGIWSHLFKSPRDYYPFWSLTYQTFVFLSRSSLSLGLPPLPRRLLPLPAIMQFLILSLLALQARSFIFSSPDFTPPSPSSPSDGPPGGVDRTVSIVFFLICLEGLCGGSSYVNTFYHVGREGEEEEAEGFQEDDDFQNQSQSQSQSQIGGGVQGSKEKRKLEREFRIGAVGASDSCGILLASLISMPLEISLCNAQVERGRTMCRDL